MLVLKALGLHRRLGPGAWPLLAMSVGLVGGALWWGWPSTKEDAWEALKFEDEGDAREAMGRALSGVRGLTEHNPGGRIPAPLAQRIKQLCQRLEGPARPVGAQQGPA